MALNPWEYADKTGNEHAHQTALFMYCARARFIGFDAALEPFNWTPKGLKADLAVELVPALRWLHAIHNQGHGDVKRGARARSEGVRAGVPDIFLPVSRVEIVGYEMRPYPTKADVAVGGVIVWHGLYIELKRPDSVGKAAGNTSGVQDEWIDYLRSAGYAAEVCYGWLEAVACIRKYLALS